MSVRTPDNDSGLLFMMQMMDRGEGRLRRLTPLGNDVWNWELFPAEPFCGAYGILTGSTCTCLHGFHSNTSRPVGLGMGCERRASLPLHDCESCSGKGETEGFIEINRDMKWPYKPKPIDIAATDKRSVSSSA